MAYALGMSAFQKWGNFSIYKKSYLSFVTSHEEKTTHRSMLSKPVVVSCGGSHLISKSYWETLVVEWEEMPQTLQLKVIGGATKVVSKAADWTQLGWPFKMLMSAFLKEFKYLFQIEDLLGDCKVRRSCEVYARFWWMVILWVRNQNRLDCVLDCSKNYYWMTR